VNLLKLIRPMRIHSKGDCKDGLYLWASDMVIVKELTEASISETVADLIAHGEFVDAFSELSSDVQSAAASQEIRSS
jgi:hypothetical protein